MLTLTTTIMIAALMVKNRKKLNYESLPIGRLYDRSKSSKEGSVT